MTREEAINWLKVINTKEFGWDEFALQESQREIRERCEQGVREAIDMAIEALSKQGEWIEKYNGNGWDDFWDYTCSNCGKKYERANAVLYHANYCPNCGAVMSVPIRHVELKKEFKIDDIPHKGGDNE